MVLSIKEIEMPLSNTRIKNCSSEEQLSQGLTSNGLNKSINCPEPPIFFSLEDQQEHQQLYIGLTIFNYKSIIPQLFLLLLILAFLLMLKLMKHGHSKYKHKFKIYIKQQILMKKHHWIFVMPSTMALSGNVSLFNIAIPQYKVDYYSSILNTIHGPFITY